MSGAWVPLSYHQLTLMEYLTNSWQFYDVMVDWLWCVYRSVRCLRVISHGCLLSGESCEAVDLGMK